MKFLGIALGLCAFNCVMAQWNLVWQDEFNFLDTNKWQHECTAWGGGNNEFQVYTPDSANSYVSGGSLHIKPTRLMDNINPLTNQPFGEEFLQNGVLDLNAMYGFCTQSDNSGCYRVGSDIPPTMSGRLRSFEKFSFRFGKVEIRARMPIGDWLWPAMWMLPENWEYGGWPISGEIDIQECRGNPDLKKNGINIGIQEAASTLHWGLSWDQNRYYLTNGIRTTDDNDYANNFHVYVLEWDEDGLRFILDGTPILSVPNPQIPSNPNWTGFYEFGKPWSRPNAPNPWANAEYPLLAPFDKEFHFILNVAVGGTNGFFPDDAINRGGTAPKPWENFSGNPPRDFWNGRDLWYPTWQNNLNSMEVDYIRVYKRA